MSSGRNRPADSGHGELRVHDEIRAEIDRRIVPWKAQLGTDHRAYQHHITRVLLICDRLHQRANPASSDPPSLQPEYLTAAVFHDLGIWTTGTLDYLAPSVELARNWLIKEDQQDLEPLVRRMIEQHHKIRQTADPASPVDVFRRADTVDLTLGLRRFGMPLHEYHTIASHYPNAGFHRRLIALTWKRLQSNPTSPLPMVKW